MFGSKRSNGYTYFGPTPNVTQRPAYYESPPRVIDYTVSVGHLNMPASLVINGVTYDRRSGVAQPIINTHFVPVPSFQPQKMVVNGVTYYRM